MTSPTGFQEIQQLGRTAAELSRIFSVEQDDTTSYEGQDQTETVHVTLAADGVVSEVRVERDWPDRVDTRRFAGAVLEAIEAASRARLSAWASTVADAQGAAEQAEGPPPRRTSRRAAQEPAPEPVPAQPVEINPSRAKIDQLLDLLHRVDVAMREPDAASAGQQTVAGESAGGHVTVTLDGKQVVDLDLEPRWLGMANNLEVASELRSAFEAGYAAARQAESEVTDAGPLAELRALTADPTAFVESLFGIRRQ